MALAQFAYAMAKNADAGFQAEVKQVYLAYADKIVGKIKQDGFGCALSKDEYTWASTKNALTQGDMLLMAYQLQPKAEYEEGALSQIHYMFGRNSLDKSFLTGMGSNPPEHPHNRIHESTGAYVPGLLVGGINSDRQDLHRAPHYSGNMPGFSYTDEHCSFASNETAINWNAPLTAVLALLCC